MISFKEFLEENSSNIEVIALKGRIPPDEEESIVDNIEQEVDFEYNKKKDVTYISFIKSIAKKIMTILKKFSLTDLIMESKKEDLEDYYSTMVENRLLLEKTFTEEEFINSVKQNFLKHFPNGFISLTHKKGLGGDYHIAGNFGMIGNLKDNVNGIPGNDKMRHSFIMFQKEENGDIWSFETSQSKIYIKPAEGSYNAMDSIKTKMGNNSKTTLEKADKKLSKFFVKLSKLMQEHKDEIYGVEDIDKKYLTFK